MGPLRLLRHAREAPGKVLVAAQGIAWYIGYNIAARRHDLSRRVTEVPPWDEHGR